MGIFSHFSRSNKDPLASISGTFDERLAAFIQHVDQRVIHGDGKGRQWYGLFPTESGECRVIDAERLLRTILGEFPAGPSYIGKSLPSGIIGLMNPQLRGTGGMSTEVAYFRIPGHELQSFHGILSPYVEIQLWNPIGDGSDPNGIFRLPVSPDCLFVRLRMLDESDMLERGRFVGLNNPSRIQFQYQGESYPSTIQEMLRVSAESLKI